MFHRNLKQLRTAHGYSMDRLCYLYNKKYNGKLNKSTLSRYENGLQEPMFSVVTNLADFFHVSVDELVRSNLAEKNEKSFPEAGAVHLVLTNKEAELLSCFHNLSDLGKEKAIEKVYHLQQAEQTELIRSTQYEQAAGWDHEILLSAVDELTKAKRISTLLKELQKELEK